MRIPKGAGRKTHIGCPKCNCRHRTVLDSRKLLGEGNGGPAIRRRVVCSRGHRYTTYERPAWAWTQEDGLKDKLKQLKEILKGL